MAEKTNDQSKIDEINIASVFLKLLFSGIAASVILGVFCNGVNGMICESYYPIVLRWENISFASFSFSLYCAVIAQGVFEGLLFGIGFSLVFTIAALVIFKKRYSWRLGIKYLFVVVLGALIGWSLGGIVGCIYATFSPTWIPSQFLPAAFADSNISFFRFAWVGGSICGMELGGLISLSFAIALMYQKSLKLQK
ncbi:MAG: hypothetical protein LBT05_00405 [Planctomycetaceae bacterium]|jgi:hypothetical protein|nr:hypothetical protein [Planctomycetaceae bacterium]